MKKLKTAVKIFTVLLMLLFITVFQSKHVYGQTTSLSIAPAIYEIATKPGNSIELTYILTNESQANRLSVSVFPFIPGDENGNVDLRQDLTLYDPLNQLLWFTIIKPKMELKQEFPLNSGEKKEIVLNIQIPEDAVGGDYYFSLLFETKLQGSNINNPSTVSQARIGTNLLINIDDGRMVDKKAKIEKFSAPLLIDSFSELVFDVIVANEGNTFFKPIGEIIVSPVFLKSFNLPLAPENILIDSTRKINCLENERIIPCGKEKGFLLGIYNATLYFSPDGTTTKYSQERTVIAFPFVLLGIILLLLTLIKTIRKSNKKKNKL